MKQASILVVEDERIVAFDLKQQLEALGYRVAAVVPSGELAVEKAAELKPDLVLMDIHLEGAMDGVEAAERIHACLRIPVIFLTAYAEDETLSRAQASLPFGYLIKPLEVREVHATIQMALVRRAAEVAVESSEERLQLALDAAELDVWEWNAATGQVSLAGHHIDALFGSAPEPVSETHDAFLARVHPENRGAIERALREALTQGSPLNLVFRYLRSTGQAGWLEAHAQVYSGTVGTAARLVGVIKDITEVTISMKRYVKRYWKRVFPHTNSSLRSPRAPYRLSSIAYASSMRSRRSRCRSRLTTLVPRVFLVKCAQAPAD
jgi:CheY-like chemotaxis protein